MLLLVVQCFMWKYFTLSDKIGIMPLKMGTRQAMRFVLLNATNSPQTRKLIHSAAAIGTECQQISSPGSSFFSIFYGVSQHCQKRFMSKSRKVQTRSKSKREPDFEKIMERQKMLSKVLLIMEILKQEPEQVMTLKSLGGFRRQINLANDHRVSVLLRKYPAIFELYRDEREVLWCGFTAEAEEVIREEGKLKKEYEATAVNYLRRFLMMSVDGELPVDKIAHFRREMGLPDDFRKEWIHKFPDFFRVVVKDEIPYLKLTAWDPALAVTELEKKALLQNAQEGINCEEKEYAPGLLCLPFPVRFPAKHRRRKQHHESLRRFQKLPYLSPYADPRRLTPGSKEFEKRAVAVMHEMLSFTLEKRLMADHLTHFRREFMLPQKQMRILLRHFGIFYVTEKGKRFNVFLTDAYEGSELIEKSPLVLWKDKVVALMSHRKKRQGGQSEIEICEGRDDYDEGRDTGECLSLDDYEKNRDEEADDDSEFEVGEEDFSGFSGEEEMDVGDVIRAYES